MFKKLLLGVITGAFLINTNFATGAEIQFNDNIIRLSSCHSSCQKMQKNKPCKINNECEKCKKSPCECKTPCEKPCSPCEKPKASWKNSDCCDRDIKNLYEFFNKADCAVGLTCEQQQKSNEIKANAAREITEAKREIATKQSEIMGLNASNSCTKNKDIRKLNREINKLQKSIKKINKNAKKDYKKLLNRTQKDLYRDYKKTVKIKGFDNACPHKKQNSPSVVK